MNKEKLKRGFHISIIIFTGLALAITYFFLLYSNASIDNAVGQVATILRPFIVGGVIAYILKSTCNGYEKLFLKAFSNGKNADAKKNASRANVLAVILTYLTWIIIVGALLLVAIPQIVESVSGFVHDIVDNLPSHIDNVEKWIADFKVQYPDLAPFVDQAGDAIINWLSTDIAPKLPQIGGSIVLGALEILNVLKDFVIGLVISVFFLAGRKVFARKTSLLIHAIFKDQHAGAIIGEARFADRMFGGFLEGKIIDSTIIGIIYFIALVIMDIRYAALLALICGVTNIIPFFGPFIGAVPSGLIILMSNEDPWSKVLGFVIFVCVIQFIDGYFIDPHIVGNNIKMSPFCVIFAVLLFGGLWGFGGLLVGVPTFAVIYDIVRKIVFHRLRKTGKKEVLITYLEESGKIKKKPVVAEGEPAEEPEKTAEKQEPSEDNKN